MKNDVSVFCHGLLFSLPLELQELDLGRILSNQRFLSWVALWLVVQPSHHIPPSRGGDSEKHRKHEK